MALSSLVAGVLGTLSSSLAARGGTHVVVVTDGWVWWAGRCCCCCWRLWVVGALLSSLGWYWWLSSTLRLGWTCVVAVDDAGGESSVAAELD